MARRQESGLSPLIQPRWRSGLRHLQAALLGAGDRRSSQQVRTYAAYAELLWGLQCRCGGPTRVVARGLGSLLL